MRPSFPWERRHVTTSNDPVTGRPLHDGDEAVESLSDDELELELTVAAHDPVRRKGRYELLAREWLTRHRGYRSRRPQPTYQ